MHLIKLNLLFLLEEPLPTENKAEEYSPNSRAKIEAELFGTTFGVPVGQAPTGAAFSVSPGSCWIQ